MIKPVSLLAASFAFAAMTVMQTPSAQPQILQPEASSSQFPIQRTSAAESAQLTTLSSNETNTLSQPQRWVF
ncbi:hypothetical protein NAU58_12450 [Pseudomonas stutzeri]|uniref:Uncharacterized protein n=1 Tax=Stutzerimonas stutzeri TaxID=316 RepID=A0A2N8S2H1_STUST|nr:hypothetical protein [Stutzerimonas stutzeri]MCQ4296389.1 hypothetical protein [Stutzerimonas stutzeri]PNF80825.1 hypothetical protein CXK92_11495 [Stutzerimonas stutzeri]